MKSFSRKRSLGRKKYEIAIVGIHPDRQSHEISYCVVPAPAADGTITTVDILDKLRYAGPYHCLMLGNGEIVEKRLHADDCVKSVLVAIPPNAAIAACRTLALTVLADARVSEKVSDCAQSATSTIRKSVSKRLSDFIRGSSVETQRL